MSQPLLFHREVAGAPQWVCFVAGTPQWVGPGISLKRPFFLLGPVPLLGGCNNLITLNETGRAKSDRNVEFRLGFTIDFALGPHFFYRALLHLTARVGPRG